VPRGANGYPGGGYPGGDQFGGFQDIFETFFGDSFGGSFFGGQASRAPSRGADAETEVEVSLREAAYGADREVNVQIVKNCEVCDGIGGTESHTCGTCGGAGAVRTVRQSLLGQMVSTQACSACGGRGRIIDVTCDNCRGGGRVSDVQTRRLRIPQGVETGMRLRVPGPGTPASPAAPRETCT
jgi:molecular chaperone DnaJ